MKDKVYVLFSFNFQQQNASLIRTNLLTDLELEASDSVEYHTWYEVVNVANA